MHLHSPQGESKIRKQLPYLRSDVEASGRAALGPTNEDTLKGSPSQETTSESSAASAYATPLSSSHEPSENAKVTLDDPTWKVLPAALKKHRINQDDWQNYAMFISFGPPGTPLYIYSIGIYLIVELSRKPDKTTARGERKALVSVQETQGCQKKSCFRA